MLVEIWIITDILMRSQMKLTIENVSSGNPCYTVAKNME
jgi:hypothetical protein